MSKEGARATSHDLPLDAPAPANSRRIQENPIQPWQNLHRIFKDAAY
jgi:hypothetical protein